MLVYVSNVTYIVGNSYSKLKQSSTFHSRVASYRTGQTDTDRQTNTECNEKHKNGFRNVSKAPGRTAKHHALNDLNPRGFASPVFHSPKNSQDCSDRTESGLSDTRLFASLSWEPGCQSHLHTCWYLYVSAAAREAGAVAEIASSGKEEKYSTTPTKMVAVLSSQLRSEAWGFQFFSSPADF